VTENREDELIILTDEEGIEHEFSIIDVIEVDNRQYAILLPADEDEEEGEAVIFRIEEEDGEDVLVDIEDDDEFERVVEVWEELLAEEEDFDEE
jgi:putative Holliday junction resolvase